MSFLLRVTLLAVHELALDAAILAISCTSA